MPYKTVSRVAVWLFFLVTISPLKLNIFPELPFTLQTLFVLLPAIFESTFIAVLIVFIYVIMGLLGLPVFAGYVGGFDAPTSGFLLGFLIASFYLSKTNVVNFWPIWIHAVVGHFIVLLFGMLNLIVFFDVSMSIFAVGVFCIVALVKSFFVALIAIFLKRYFLKANLKY